MTLTQLAYKYQVEILLRDCEHSLKHSHEIPVIDRLLLADKLKLKSVLVSRARILMSGLNINSPL